jgi:uncharacterized membrane protein
MTDELQNPTGSSDKKPISRFRRTHFRRMLVTGLVILVPVTLTVYILKQIFDLMDGIFSPIIDRTIGIYFPGAHIPGLGFLLTLLLVLLLGWLSTNVVGRRVIQAAEKLICRIPVAKSIYSATKGVLEAVSTDQAEAFKRVVLIEYPKDDIFAVAFVTRWARWPTVHEKTADLLLVFVPTTPNPTSGFLLLVPRSEAIDLPISVEEGVRMVISGGILLPKLPDLPLGTTVQVASKHS